MIDGIRPLLNQCALHSTRRGDRTQIMNKVLLAFSSLCTEVDLLVREVCPPAAWGSPRGASGV